MMGKGQGRTPSVLQASTLLVLLAVILTGCTLMLNIPPQLSLLFGTVICCVFAGCLDYHWQQIEEMIVDGLSAGLLAMLINAMIGMLIAVLCACGTMPYMMCLGLRIVSPRFFLLSVFLLCAVFSTCLGSSYTTAGTIGVALMELSAIMRSSPAVVCGAILCGCYFGEKLSPVSEAVNVSSACAGAILTRHIQAMRQVMVPSALITALVYLAAGLFAAQPAEQISYGFYEQEFAAVFRMGPVLIVPLAVMALMILIGRPALITLTAGIAVSCLLGILYQGISLKEMADMLLNGCAVTASDPEINRMLHRGGVNSMSDIIAVMLFGMPLGGLLKGTGALEVIVSQLGERVKSVPGVVIASSICSMAAAAMTGSNYPAYLLTVSAFSKTYDSLGLDRSMLSRSCEMAGFCGVMLPWTTTGVFMASVLGVSPFSYAPCFQFGFLVPICTIVCSCNGWIDLSHNRQKGAR